MFNSINKVLTAFLTRKIIFFFNTEWRQVMPVLQVRRKFWGYPKPETLNNSVKVMLCHCLRAILDKEVKRE